MEPRALGIVIFVLFAGCADRQDRTAAAAPGPAPSTQPLALQPINARYGIYLARIDIRTTIAADGRLRSVRTHNKSYGPADKVVEQIEIRQGRLTPEQMSDLARLFVGWDALSDVCENVPDGPEVQIRYGDKVITGGRGLPRQVWDVHRRITELATSMPKVER
jgi:hypothetical protein